MLPRGIGMIMQPFYGITYACLYILQQLQPRDLHAARFLGGPVYVNVAPQPPINDEFLNRAPVSSSHYAQRK